MEPTHPLDFWEPHRPAAIVDQFKPRSKVDVRDGRKWITYRDTIRRSRKTIAVVVEMPENAPTKSCDQGRHHQCGHRRGGPHEGGIGLKVTKPSFIWRCGCACHRDPERIGLLF